MLKKLFCLVLLSVFSHGFAMDKKPMLHGKFFSLKEAAEQTILDHFLEYRPRHLVQLPGDAYKSLVSKAITRCIGSVPLEHVALCKGHTKDIAGLRVSLDHKIVSWSQDATVRIWDMSGNQLAVCRGHTLPVKGACITPTNDIVSWSYDGTLRIWDIHGNPLGVCEGHTDTVSGACIAPDEKIVSWSDDGSVRIWNMKGEQLALCEGQGRVAGVRLMHDNKLVVWFYDATMHIWTLQGKHLHECSGHTGIIANVCIASDTTLVSCGTDGKVILWDSNGNFRGEYIGHTEHVSGITITDDNSIVSQSNDTTLAIWDMQGNRLGVCRGHTGELSAALVVGTTIVSKAWDNTVRFWDMQGNAIAECTQHKGAISILRTTLDDKIVSGDREGILCIFDLKGNHIGTADHNNTQIEDAVVYKDKIITVGSDRALHIWDLGRLHTIESIDDQNKACQILKVVQDALVHKKRDAWPVIWSLLKNQQTQAGQEPEPKKRKAIISLK